MTIDKTRIAAQVAALHAFKNDPEARMSLSDLGRILECKQFTEWLRLRTARAAKLAQRHDWDDWKVRK